MIKYIIQFLLFYWIWKSNKKQKGHWFLPSSVLLGIYALSAALAIPTLYYGYYTEPYSGRYWLPMIEFSAFVLMFIIPFRAFDESRMQKIVLPNIKVLNVISIVIIILSFYAIFYYLGTVRQVLAAPDIKEFRNLIASGEGYSESGILNTIASVSSSLNVFAITLFFIYLIIEGFKPRTVLLFISSFSEPIHVLTFLGRDGIVFWIFSFLFLWALFKKFLPNSYSKKIRKMLLYAGVIMAIPFLMISISRFSDGYDEGGGTVYSFVSYLGQGFINGPLYFGIDNRPVSNKGFILINEILHKSQGAATRTLSQYGDWKSWAFGTLVVSLYRSLGGSLGLISFGLGALFLFYIVLGKRKTIFRFNHLIIYILYFQVVSQGVFYFRQYTRGGNLFILLCLFGALFVDLFLRDPHPVVLYPTNE